MLVGVIWRLALCCAHARRMISSSRSRYRRQSNCPLDQSEAESDVRPHAHGATSPREAPESRTRVSSAALRPAFREPRKTSVLGRTNGSIPRAHFSSVIPAHVPLLRLLAVVLRAPSVVVEREDRRVVKTLIGNVSPINRPSCVLHIPRVVRE
jgi:hypothetical protein